MEWRDFMNHKRQVSQKNEEIKVAEIFNFDVIKFGEFYHDVW